MKRIGPRATAAIQHFEGCALRAYRCPAGRWTIGWGNTYYEDGSPVRPGDSITRDRAEALFTAVVHQYERGAEAALQGSPATAAQFGALVSLGWNIGLAALGRSILMRMHRAGQIEAAAAQFERWRFAGGRPEFGLVRRRAVERRLYLNDLPGFDRALALYRDGQAGAADRFLGISR